MFSFGHFEKQVVIKCMYANVTIYTIQSNKYIKYLILVSDIWNKYKVRLKPQGYPCVFYNYFKCDISSERFGRQ